MLLMPTRSLMAEAREDLPVGSSVSRRFAMSSLEASAPPSRWEPHIKKRLCTEMARRFEVSEMAMNHRLGEWPAEVYKHVERALESGADTLL